MSGGNAGATSMPPLKKLFQFQLTQAVHLRPSEPLLGDAINSRAGGIIEGNKLHSIDCHQSGLRPMSAVPVVAKRSPFFASRKLELDYSVQPTTSFMRPKRQRLILDLARISSSKLNTIINHFPHHQKTFRIFVETTTSQQS